MSCIICGEPNPCGGSFCPCCDEREQRKIQEEQDFNSALDLANERLIAEQDAEIAALREKLTFETNRLNALWSGEKYLRERDQAEIAALREAEKELEYANAMFTAENKSLREAIIGMEGGLNVADSWRNHPVVRRALEEGS